MPYTVFFREGKETFTANNFIDQQSIAHREVLQTITNALATNGTTTHPFVRKNSKGEWSVLLQDDKGDVYTYTLFISHFEQQEADRKGDTETISKKRELIIIDPSGPKDSVGGYHPGYWSTAHYASLLEEEQRNLFLKTVDQIVNNIPSSNYSIKADGSISIHIHKQGGAYTIAITCRAEWR